MTFIPNNFELKDLKKIILQDFPEMPITSEKLLNNGWDNVALEINEEYIFRFPKDEEYRFAEEIKLLEFLKGKITLSIPNPEFIGKSLVYMGYKKIPGEDMTEDIYNALTETEKQSLIFDLANFAKEFHQAISLEKARELNIATEKLKSYTANLYSNLETIIKDKETLEFVADTIDEYNEMIKTPSEQVVLYNDLHTENMAFDTSDKKLNGVFDFGDVAIGDVDREFYTFYKFNQELFKGVVEKYEELSGRKISLRKAVLYMRIGEMADLAEFKDRPETDVYQNAMNRIGKWMKEKDVYKE